MKGGRGWRGRVRREETEPVLWKNEPRLQTLKTPNLCLCSAAPTTQKFRWLYFGQSFCCLKNSELSLLHGKSVKIKREVQHHWDYHQSNPNGPWLKLHMDHRQGQVEWVGGWVNQTGVGLGLTPAPSTPPPLTAARLWFLWRAPVLLETRRSAEPENSPVERSEPGKRGPHQNHLLNWVWQG